MKWKFPTHASGNLSESVCVVGHPKEMGAAMGKLTGDMTEEFDSTIVEKSHECVPNGNIVSILG